MRYERARADDDERAECDTDQQAVRVADVGLEYEPRPGMKKRVSVAPDQCDHRCGYTESCISCSVATPAQRHDAHYRTSAVRAHQCRRPSRFRTILAHCPKFGLESRLSWPAQRTRRRCS